MGLRLSLRRDYAPDALELVDARDTEETLRRSIAEALAVIELLHERIPQCTRNSTGVGERVELVLVAVITDGGSACGGS
jgi:hypothetical protein